MSRTREEAIRNGVATLKAEGANRATIREQVRQFNRFEKKIKRLTPDQINMIHELADQKANSMVEAIVEDLMCNFHECYRAALYELGYHREKVNEINVQALLLIKEYGKKIGSIDETMSKKKDIENQIKDLVAKLAENMDRAAIVDEVIFKIPLASKSMIHKQIDLVFADIKKVEGVFEAAPKEISKEEKQLISKVEDIIETAPQEIEPIKLSKLKVKEVIVEGENGVYSAGNNGVKLEVHGVELHFKNIAELENWVQEFKEVFGMIQ